MKFKRQIPNILSVIRLLMIPLVVWFFFSDDRVMACVMFALANITDIADGIIARRYGFITELGKILDPLADKLLQVTTAVCLAISNPVYIILAVLLVVKELAMLIGGLIIIRNKSINPVSAWYGKAASVCYFVIVCIMILFESIAPFDLILTLLECAIALAALVLYYFKSFKSLYGIELFKKHK